MTTCTRVTCCVTALALSTVAAAQGLPRYRLAPGQKITYETRKTTDLATSAGAYRRESEGTWTLWVLGARDDGAWPVIVGVRNRLVSTREGEEPKEMWDKSWYGRFALHADGRYVYDDSLGFSLDPRAILIPLPASAGELERGWEHDDARFQVHHRVTVDRDRPADAAALPLRLERSAITDDIYLVEEETRALFDLERGLVREITSESRQTWGSGTTSAGRTTLASVEEVDLAELAALDREVAEFSSVTRRYEQMTEASQSELPTLDAAQADALRVLEAGRAKLTIPALIAEVDEMIDLHSRRINYHRDRAERRAALIGKPAPDWVLEDLDGNSVSLADLRGKVVVLDFWYRGCTWCVRCMPQLQALVHDMAGAPFVLFGMNTDEDIDDARFVVEKMGLDYPSLRATGIPEAYKVSAFPTLIVIGPDGIVRGVHVGYTTDLRETVAREVRALLARPAE
jgi:peroxiredoxin